MRLPVFGACTVFALAGCFYGGATTRGAVLPAASASSVATSMATGNPVGKYIKHVVIVIQENRSFDNLFYGFPGADSATYGYTHTGQKIPLKPVTLVGKDLVHGWRMALMDWNVGKMNGFDRTPIDKLYPYSYVKRPFGAPYWKMASEYVLADRMFPTMFGPSFTSHLDLIAGNTNIAPNVSEANLPTARPWGCDAPAGTITYVVHGDQHLSPGPFPCFTQFRTMADTLDAAHVPWRYYAPPLEPTAAVQGGAIWTAFDAIQNVRDGPDWANVITPQTKVLTDITSGNLASVSWVVPDWKDSDHPGADSDTGPSWVAAVVNTIGESQYWDSTAIVVTWDEWGGWYDHVPPPRLDFRGLGIRVPCIIIAPYVKPHVAHTHYEFASILKLVEEAFGLPVLGLPSQGYTDTRARSLVDSFNFTQAPRTFKPIPAPYPVSHFLSEQPSLRAPDDL